MNTTQIYDPADTICAICTPPGTGAIAVIRVSGPDAFTIADIIWKGKPLAEAGSHTAHLGEIVDPATGEILDQALATVFRAPNTFTGDDIVELSTHGSRWIQRQLIDLLTRNGCRLALPGEYTRRAFAAGKMDLSEAEAVADVIAASSKAAHRLAINQMRGLFSRRLNGLRDRLVHIASLVELELDFSEEDVEFADRKQLHSLATELHAELNSLADSFSTGEAIKDGIPVAIIGPTNAGKSSLLNSILGDDRAIVSDIHGTTRDIIEDTLEIGPYLIRFQDTAGLRHTTDEIENIGIDRSLRAARTARIVLYLIDPTATRLEIPVFDAPTVYIVNKTDIASPAQTKEALSAAASNCTPKDATITISAKKGRGIAELKQLIERLIDSRTDAHEDTLIVTNARHAEALRAAATSLSCVIAGLTPAQPTPVQPTPVQPTAADLSPSPAATDTLTTDLIAEHLRQTIHHLSSITGEITTSDILQSIFANFCIGK